MSTSVIPHGGVLVDLLVPRDQVPELKKQAAHFPNLTLTHRQLCDLELLMNGGFSPLTQFMDRCTYLSVVDNMQLPNGLIWAMPITLDVEKKTLDALGVVIDDAEVEMDRPGKAINREVALRDEEHNLIAIMTITDVYRPNRVHEAEKVFGTTSVLHPGSSHLVKHGVNGGGAFYISGPIKGIQLPIHYDYNAIRRTPSEVRAMFESLGWKNVVAFQTRNPMHRAHRELTMRAIETGGQAEGISLKLLLHPVVGETKPGDIDYHTRVKCYREVVKTYPEGAAQLSLLPLAMRMGGPREAVWHAIIRKNFGCSHFIVGRDHAGPGNDENNKPFYDDYAAQELCLLKEKDLGIKILPFQMMVYLEKKQIYCPADEVPEGEPIANISGTKLRHLLRTGGDIPAWFTYPTVSSILRSTYPPRSQQGYTIFFTGLSGGGKSTIANALYIKLLEEAFRSVTLLDGDVVRQNLSSELGFSKEHRDLNVKRIGYVASEITKSRGIAICAPIAPYTSTRKEVRGYVENYGMGGFIEVHIATPIDVCEARDKKGLYAKARSGILKNFTGIDDPYEEPVNPEVRIDTSKTPVRDAVQNIVDYLRNEGYLPRRTERA